MIRGAEAQGMTAVVRVFDDTPKLLSRYQDIGAHGVQVPMVHTAEQAERIVRAMKFSPDGVRGMSGGRQNGDVSPSTARPPMRRRWSR